MMKQQPDQLFRDTLKNYHKQVPTTAWSRISDTLEKKKKGNYWITIAASFLILALSIILLPRFLQNSSHQVVGEKVIPSKKNGAEINPPNKIEPALKKENNELPAVQKAIMKTHGNQKKEILKRETKQAEVFIAIVENDPIKTPEVTTTEKVFTRDKNSSKDDRKKGFRVTFIYQAEEVNEKYLNKNAPAEATSAKNKPSTLKRWMAKAYDLKHNQEPLANLRLKKNEIFAFNFKGEKQRIQNK